MDELRKKFEEILGVRYYAPHSPADGTKWEHDRCGDCFCTRQEVHTHDEQVARDIPLLLQAVGDISKETKKEILSKITDLAFRKYPPRHILKELGKDLRA